MAPHGVTPMPDACLRKKPNLPGFGNIAGAATKGPPVIPGACCLPSTARAHSRPSPPAPPAAPCCMAHKASLWCSRLTASNPLCQSEAKVKRTLEPHRSLYQGCSKRPALRAGRQSVTLHSHLIRFSRSHLVHVPASKL